MPTPKKGARLGGSASNQRKILSNLAAQLFEHGAIKTTDAKAKMLRPYAEKLITKAKSGSLSDRRLVLQQVPHKDVVSHLFDELAPQFEGREGGYTRIIKLDNRAGDNAPMSQISLVLEETVSTEASRATRAAASKQAEEAKAEDTAVEETEAQAPGTDEVTPTDAPEVSENVTAPEATVEDKTEDK